MCHKQANHVVFFRPFKDTHDINRAHMCTVWDRQSGLFARGFSVLSLDDEADDEMGRQLAYNRAARVLMDRPVNDFRIEKAWEAVQALKPVELGTLFAYLANGRPAVPPFHAYLDFDLSEEELRYFTRKGLHDTIGDLLSSCTNNCERGCCNG